MKTKRKRVVTALVSCMALLFATGCSQPVVKQAPPPVQASQPPPPPPPQKTASFPAFELPIPESEEGKTYLGLSGSGNFNITQIKTEVLVIEAFSMYCPHCQKEAPHVNELYRAIEASSELQEKIKIIGIGVGNSAYEVKTFKEKYEVPFPLFPDKEMSVTQVLGIMKTPTFIGVTINEDGTHQDFYFKSGKLGDIDKFITKMVSQN